MVDICPLPPPPTNNELVLYFTCRMAHLKNLPEIYQEGSRLRRARTPWYDNHIDNILAFCPDLELHSSNLYRYYYVIINVQRYIMLFEKKN